MTNNEFAMLLDLEQFGRAEEEFEKLRDKNERLLSQLNNLLARIHRDGGHYTTEHGLEQSVAAADSQVVEMLGALQAAYDFASALLQYAGPMNAHHYVDGAVRVKEMTAKALGEAYAAKAQEDAP